MNQINSKIFYLSHGHTEENATIFTQKKNFFCATFSGFEVCCYGHYSKIIYMYILYNS
jgi:hypothetical protein